MKILLDENLSPRHAKSLRNGGIDARSVVEDGLCGASDDRVRAHAIAQDRILVTLDADFANIMRYSPAGTPGVIWLKLNPPSETAIAHALDSVLQELNATAMSGKLAVVDGRTIRLRTA